MKHTLSKKGVSLAELVVVLAVIAIVSTMVTTFCILINGYHNLNQRRAQVVEQLANVEELVTDFLMAYDSASYTVACEETHITVTEISTGTTKSLQVSEGIISAAFPGSQRTQATAALSAVTFTRQISGDNCLVLCTITYVEPKLMKSDIFINHTFAVHPKLLKATN